MKWFIGTMAALMLIGCNGQDGGRGPRGFNGQDGQDYTKPEISGVYSYSYGTPTPDGDLYCWGDLSLEENLDGIHGWLTEAGCDLPWSPNTVPWAFTGQLQGSRLVGLLSCADEYCSGDQYRLEAMFTGDTLIGFIYDTGFIFLAGRQ